MPFELPIASRIRKSPYFDRTVAEGATALSVYNHMYMPMSYGDPEGEYWRLIDGVSMWDVAGERQVQLKGPDAAKLAQMLAPRDVAKIRTGVGVYAPLSDQKGRLLNDPILLKLDEDRFWLSIADNDMLYWSQGIALGARLDVEVTEPDVSPLAIQGPKAFDVAAAIFGDWVRDLKHFHFRETEIAGIPVAVQRSGWSHQGGIEIYLMDGTKGGQLWDIVREAGQPFDIAPGTPNATERVESDLLSWGSDTWPEANALEVGLGKFVNLKMAPDFIGKTALQRIADTGPARRRRGLFIEGAPLDRAEDHWPVLHDGWQVGVATTAVWSLRLERNIAICLIASDVPEDAALFVQTPEGLRDATLTSLPFCKPGRPESW